MITSQRFDFRGARGHLLSGRIERPQATPRGWAIFAHCFTCGKASLAAVRIARALALAGIGVLRFDFAGLGGSEGEFANGTFGGDVADLVAAGRAMADAGMVPSLLIGHSLGGAAVLMAAGDMPSIRAVATIGAPADVAHILGLFDAAALARIEAEGEAEVCLGGRPFTVGKSLVEDVQHQTLEAHIAQLRRPLLVMHAPGDKIVGIKNGADIFAAANYPKCFVSLDEADHLLTRRPDAEYAATMLAAWASRYLEQVTEDLAPVAPTEGVVAEDMGLGDFQLCMRSGEHHFLADEPVSFGGLGSGLSPFELVSAGLAACTVMTMKMYAKRKGLPLERARTKVVHTKRADETPADLFTRTIELHGPLNADERQKLLAIADRCPVDLTLVRGADVQTVLAE